MGFDKLFGADKPASSTSSTPVTTVIESEPVTVTETQEVDMRADYEQRASHRRGLLSTILSNRNRTAALASSSTGGNTTLG